MKTIAERIYSFMNGETKTMDEIAEAFPEKTRSSLAGRLHENLGKKFIRVGKGVFKPMSFEEVQAQREKEGFHYGYEERPMSYAENQIMQREQPNFPEQRIPEVKDKALLESLKLMKGIIEQAILKIEA